MVWAGKVSLVMSFDGIQADTVTVLEGVYPIV